MEKKQVAVGGWGTIDKCDMCGLENVAGVLTWDDGQICNHCLSTKCEEVPAPAFIATSRV